MKKIVIFIVVLSIRTLVRVIILFPLICTAKYYEIDPVLIGVASGLVFAKIKIRKLKKDVSCWFKNWKENETYNGNTIQ